MPLLFAQVVKQLLMHEAAIGKQSDHLTCGHDGTYLIEHGLIGFKTDLGAPVADGSPSQRNSPTTIQQGGADQHKGREGSRIQCDAQACLRRPINESGLQHRFIPLCGRDSRMM